MKKRLFFSMMLCASLMMFSCSKDDSTDEPQMGGKGNILLTIMQPNPDGVTGSQYLLLVDENNFDKGVDITNAMPMAYGAAAPVIDGNSFYVFPSYMGETENVVKKYTVTDGIMKQTGALQVPVNSAATNLVVVSRDKAYLSLGYLNQIMVFNPTTMTKIKTIDLPADIALENDGNADPGAMIYRDNYLFIGLNQMVGGWMSPVTYKQSDVAIIDCSNDTYKTTITTSVNGLTTPTRPIDPNSIIVDEKGDIYIRCVGNFGASPEQNSGFLRIPKDQLTFDETYNWDVSTIELTNTNENPAAPAQAKGYAGMIASSVYAGNGILYGYVDVPAFYEGDAATAAYTSFSYKAVKFDLYNKTMTPVEGIAQSNGFAMMAGYYGDKIVLSNESKTSKGIYVVNKSTNSIEPTTILNSDYKIAFWAEIGK